MNMNRCFCLYLLAAITALVSNGYVAAQEAVYTVLLPDSFRTTADYERRENRILLFAQTLTVSDNDQWQRYGQLKLSSARLFAPTDVAKPNSSEYRRIVASNALNAIVLDDGSDNTYPSPLPFADSNGTRRVGSRIDSLKAKLIRKPWGWTLIPVADHTPQFYDGQRPTSVEINQEHNLKVCSFNLRYYLTSNFGTGFGPDSQAEADKQHAKTVKALIAIDADIYGLVEIQQGQNAIRKLCDALNANAGSNIYSFIDDGGSEYGSYTKVGFIYRNDKVSPYGTLKNINNIIPHRKKLQCFVLLQNNERFILSLNHFKSKTGSNATGDNADADDGQGLFNGDRKREASAVLSALTSYSHDSADNDILVMGDLNAYAQEDPLYMFYENGYIDAIKQRNDSAYSYRYRGLAGCLDHALASPTMTSQIVDVKVFHINADEPEMFAYNQNTWQDNPYRSSDHDAVVVALKLGGTNATTEPNADEIKIIKTSNRSFVVGNAGNNWLKTFDLSGKLLLYRYIASNRQDVILPFDLKGVYIFLFDDNATRKRVTLKALF